MLFNGVDVNEGDTIEVTFRTKVESVSEGYFSSGVYLQTTSGDYFTSDNLDDYESISINVVEQAFPLVVSSVIEHIYTCVRLTLNDDGEWIDLTSNVIYAVEDLGPRSDYVVRYRAEEE